MNNSRAILYNLNWQLLRMSCKGQFVKSSKSVDTTCERLDDYIASTGGNLAEAKARLYRCINLLNGTRMGFTGMGLVNSPQDLTLVKWRNHFQWRYNNLVNVKFPKFNWDGLEGDLIFKIVHLKLDKSLEKLLVDLKKRRDKTIQKYGHCETRPELVKVIQILEKHV